MVRPHFILALELRHRFNLEASAHPVQTMSLMNRKGNASNPYQGKYKRVLCVCSAGLLRSPTAALVLSKEPFNYNTRAAGLSEEYALIQVDDVLLEWCDEIVCMDEKQEAVLRESTHKPIHNLKISDNFEYRDKGLMEMIFRRYSAILEESNGKQTQG